MREFKKFLLRGSVVDLAVAVVIGAAFGALISSFVRNLLTPLIGILGKRNFNSLQVTVRGSVFHYGQFANDVLTFVLVVVAIYFAVVKPMNALNARRQRRSGEGPEKRDCPECLSEIPARARRCAFCTAELAPVS